VEFQLSTSWPSLRRERLLAAAIAAFGDRRGGVVLCGQTGAGKSHLLREVRAELNRAASEPIVWLSVAGTREEEDTALAAVDTLLDGVDASAIRSGRKLAQAAHEAIVETAAGRPVVIEVENAQLLDTASAELIARIARLGDIKLLIASRTTAPQRAALVSLWTDELVGRIDVPTLAPDELETILWSALGGPVESALTRDVLYTTGGNVGLARQLVRANVAAETIVQTNGTWIRRGRLVPDAHLIDVVTAELGRYTPEDRHAIELVALSEPVPLAIARPCIGADTLDRLTTAGVLRVTRGRSANRATLPVLRLPHPLYADCIRAMVTPARSHALHEEVYPQAPGASRQTLHGLVRWAEWTLECGLDIDPEALTLAAGAASSNGDYEAAIDLATAALDARPSPIVRIDALAIRARELRFRDRPAQAIRDVEDAITLQRVIPADLMHPADDRILDLHDLRADIEQYGLNEAAHAIELMGQIYTEIIQRGGNMDQVQRYRMSRIARHGWSGDFRPALAASEELASGPVPGSTWTLQAVAPVILAQTWRGQTAQAVAISERYRPAASAYDAALPRVGAEIHLSTFLLHVVSGRLSEARRLGADPRSPGGATRLDSALTFAGEARLLSAEGRWHEADEKFRIARQLFEIRDPSGFSAWAFASEAHCALMVGDHERAEALCRRVDHTPMRASRAFEADIRAQVITTLSGLGHRDASGRAIEMSLWAEERGHYLAELWALDLFAVTSPRLARASGTAERAHALLDLVDAPVAPSLVNHIDAIIETDSTLEKAATAQLARFGRWIPSSMPVHIDLSPREQEVASLVTAGLSSAAIAERLHVSTRTVETHLSRVYAKLGVNRRSLVAEALRKHSA
jgi:DNA-binding CsgD family transcriptional regulator/tetratricopeptide (TPR) repeat protein